MFQKSSGGFQKSSGGFCKILGVLVVLGSGGFKNPNATLVSLLGPLLVPSKETLTKMFRKIEMQIFHVRLAR